MSARAKLLEQKKLNALVSHLDATEGPCSAASLSRSYGVGQIKITEILRKLRESVDQGLVDAITAAAAPIINPLALNRAKRRKKRVTPPKQISIFDLPGVV